MRWRLGFVLAAVLLVATAGPAASLSRTFCFFDAGSAELTPRSQAVMIEFADYWLRVRQGEERTWPDNKQVPARAMPVEINAHIDAAEARQQKAALSRVRAEAVRAFLERNGVPPEVMTILDHGADRPLVPSTEAEPQNRFVWIVPR